MGWTRTSAEILQGLENPPFIRLSVFFYQIRDSIIVVLQYIDDGEDNGEDDDE